MKKQSNLSRLLGYAGNHKYLIYASWILSAVSALVSLVPYWYIWLVMREVLETAPHFENAVGLTHNGWIAEGFAVAAVTQQRDVADVFCCVAHVWIHSFLYLKRNVFPKINHLII